MSARIPRLGNLSPKAPAVAARPRGIGKGKV
jgi:hypothetical protein